MSQLTCPLCDWSEQAETGQYSESNLAAAPAVAEAMGLPAGALLSIHAQQAQRRDESTLERHLSMHGPHDWLPALMDARAGQGELVNAHERAAARHTTVRRDHYRALAGIERNQ